MRFLIVFLLCIFANASVVTKSYTSKAIGEGYGKTYEIAVDNALAEAVLKLNGAKIQTSTSVSSDLSSINNENELYKRFNQQISKATNGRFSAFEVLSKEQTSDGFRVVVEIKKTSTIKSYKAPGMQTNRNKIIVAPALDPNNYSLMGRDSEQVLRDLRFRIESNITKTRKFNLLDRQAGEALATEREIIEQDGALDEALKLGKNLGTDYILLYSISDAQTSKGKEIAITGSKTKSKVKIYVNYQVIVFATREIKFSDSVDFEFATNDYNEILNNIANSIVLNTQAAIYPPKIEKVTKDNLAVFTQKLPLNTKLECYKRGEKIYDSYTKELNGYEEEYMSLVEVVNANSKTSYAKILDGNIEKGLVCRFKQSNTTNDANGKDVKDVIPVNGGGFIF